MESDSRRLHKFFDFLSSIKSAYGKADLRFNVPYVGVCWIADQFFCEKQVELYMRGEEVKIERTKVGKDFHEGIYAGMEKADLEKFGTIFFQALVFMFQVCLLQLNGKKFPLSVEQIFYCSATVCPYGFSNLNSQT